ncbi:hypothetical protein VHA01S_008_00810 [Vibrio halioticoli NBRC 102217]|uniref:Uncharacterized protein n=1 Tax=Vibrio halioticoli NBRC 102217 TaxID=1219072 RepID=V5FFK2_9VIBR|nr:hypothetical protein [Vibrio halioticoli]GAD88686.1 hypothetical protein VHA01S_008_00810 [Vibrio halioticoli NBRC 102217]
MDLFIDIHELVTDGSVWLAIIAINMTIIGLTSLAESKSVIGIDYGQYLIKSYKVFFNVKIYHLLVIFALINIISLFSMFTTNYSVRVINLIILMLSLAFAIYYFFAYILIKNPRVNKQIYMDELLGIYYDSNDKTNFEADIITEMNNGWRTDKRISSNLISYFDKYNAESRAVFGEIFGPKSVVYAQNKTMKKYWLKNYNVNAFNYNSNSGGVHISHEFFQLYRYSELQEKWLLEILSLFNKEYSSTFKESRIDNIIRILAHINRFGRCDNLYGYKFLEYLSAYIYDAMEVQFSVDQKDSIKNRKAKELFLMNELFLYVMNTLETRSDSLFYNASVDLCKLLITDSKFNHYSDSNDKIELIINISRLMKSDCIKNFISEVVYNYTLSNIEFKYDLNEIKSLINIKKKNDSIQAIKQELYH